MARLSRLAYRSRRRFAVSSFKLGYPSFRYVRVAELDVFVVANIREMVVVFRGSNTLSDWLNNLRIRKSVWRELDGGRVHSGFASAIELAWPQLKAAMEELRFDQQKIWLTGHSQGGSLAVLAAVPIGRAFSGAPLAVFSFGATDVGDEAFVAWYDGRIQHLRVEHRYDVVPRLLRRRGYALTGTLHQLGAAGAWWRWIITLWYHGVRRYEAGMCSASPK